MKVTLTDQESLHPPWSSHLPGQPALRDHTAHAGPGFYVLWYGKGTEIWSMATLVRHNG